MPDIRRDDEMERTRRYAPLVSMPKHALNYVFGGGTICVYAGCVSSMGALLSWCVYVCVDECRPSPGWWWWRRLEWLLCMRCGTPKRCRLTRQLTRHGFWLELSSLSSLCRSAFNGGREGPGACMVDWRRVFCGRYCDCVRKAFDQLEERQKLGDLMFFGAEERFAEMGEFRGEFSLMFGLRT